MRIGEALIQTLWVGALWTVGYIVAPALFKYLDTSAEAGRMAGQLFTILTWLSVVCGGLLLVGVLRSGRSRRGAVLRAGLIILMLLLLCASEWLVRPLMESARLPDGTPGEGFAMLHGISAVLYLVASLAGIFLVALGARQVRAQGAE